MPLFLAEGMQVAVLFFGTLTSWGIIGLCGVLFGSQKNFLLRTLEAIVPATHELKFLFAPRYYNYSFRTFEVFI